MESRVSSATEARTVRKSANPIHECAERQRKSTPVPQGSTHGMAAPLVEDKRAPPIQQSRREMELGLIGRIVSCLKPKLSAEEGEKLDAAAMAAEAVRGISPKTEFIARLENGLFGAALEEYGRIAAKAK